MTSTRLLVIPGLLAFVSSAALAHDPPSSQDPGSEHGHRMPPPPHRHAPDDGRGDWGDGGGEDGGELPDNQVEIEVRDGYRQITANGVPDHAPGEFPNANNPNSIRAQRHRFRVPAAPEAAEIVTPLGLHPFGVAINGVPFDPGAAEFWNRDPGSGWQYEALSGTIDLGLDEHHAHVQPSGAYHYHGTPTGLVDAQPTGRMVLVGYAADGFPIYTASGHSDATDPEGPPRAMQSSYRLKAGLRPDGSDGPGGAHDGTFVQDYKFVPGAGDLDECNGRVGVTPEYPEGTYHYVITSEFPFIPRSFRGTPDESFIRRGPPPGRRRGPGGGPPPPRRGGRRPR